MKKKLIPLTLAAVCALGCTFGLTACGGNTPLTVNGIVIAKTGEQPDHGQQFVNTSITYGETPDLNFYKLYVYYSNGDLKEIARTDDKLTVNYSYFKSGTSNTIENLPGEYLAGSYTIEYIYDGKTDSMYKATATINVNKANSGAFSVQPAKSTWREDENTPNVIVKNPKGAAVQSNNWASVALQTNDTNCDYYSLYYIKKDVYDAFTEAQKTDWDFIQDFYSADVNKDEREIWYYSPNQDYTPAGNYMLFATIYETYNYQNIVTSAVQITVTAAE